MYNALIVEDEKLELDALYKILSTHCPQLDEIVTCDNGDAVVELLQTYTPDIVLMDVHLGNTNGIDLSESIRKMLPSARIIVITAFDQFSYAQRAVKLGLADYLLKPVSTPRLLNAIRAQTDILDAQRKDLVERVRHQSNLSLLQQGFFSSMVSSIIHNCMGANTKETMKMFGLPSACMQLFVLRLNLQEFDFSDSEMAILKKLVVDGITTASEHIAILYDFMATDAIVLCSFFPSSEAHADADFLTLMQQVLVREFHIPYRIGVSEIVYEPEELPAACKRTFSALQLSDGIICTSADLISENNNIFNMDRLKNELVNCLVQLDAAALDRTLLSLRQATTHSFSGLSETKAALVMLWVETLHEMELRLSYDISDSTKMLNPISEFIACTQLNALYEACSIHYLSLLQAVEGLLIEKKDYVALRAQRYIEKHYTEPLTLQSISGALKISPYYLCHVFKCSLNTGVIEYTNYCRIEAAKSMLRSENSSIKDVAAAVGFVDSNYFCRVFKRNVGITPSAYKRLRAKNTQ